MGSRAGGIVFFGDPVMDLLVSVADDLLQDAGLQVGGCVPVEPGELRTLLQAVQKRDLLLG